jgi:hypothetical protein
MRAEEHSDTAEIVERWQDHGRRIYAALDDTDYERVASLIDEREALLVALERVAPRIENDQRATLLSDEDELQTAIAKHTEYIEEKLSGVGRMRLGMRKYRTD